MSFLTTIKGKIGNELYAHLEKEAENEVAAAMQMPLKDQYRQDQYFRPKFFRLLNLLSECQRFEALGLKISPADVIDVLFKSKLLFAAQDEDEYMKRIGGGMKNFGLWRDKSNGTVDQIIERKFEALASSLEKRTLLAEVNSFVELNPNQSRKTHQKFFEELFAKLEAPFVAFFDDGNLLAKHKSAEPNWREEYYDEKRAREYFCAPSIGFTAEGSEVYCYWYAQAWLRTFFHVLRIGGFIHPGQQNFGDNGVKFMGVKSSVFLGEHAQGCFNWQEDTKVPWAKTADGSLFLSFGYRGLAQMWLDVRTYTGIERVFLENKKIFEHLRNPWNEKALQDVIPTLDILSSATQIPDVGAKILLIYCCLEHLFVPANVRRDNKKYIVGGINALRSDLLPWFDRLNDLRNEYAHKGFVLKDDKTRALTVESMNNVLSLLVAKLANA
ncbi:MAG TPA: hypothetical protein VMB22_00475 [Verrucomicrobiae bacterium]|nr:hypothetical protein [Verrucomicrobiae bacterium]